MGSNQLLRDMGARICARRKELHLTQEQVAEQMNVSLQMVSNLELGKKAIRPENLLRLCQTLEISADYILSGHYSVKESLDISDQFLQMSSTHQRIIRQLIESLVQNDHGILHDSAR